MSYIGRHIADIRVARAPLDALLKADTPFSWKEEHSEAFEKCKRLARNTATLAHYDDNLPLVLTTDASSVGLGACLSHRVTVNGKTFLRPLSYASCSLKPAELNYAQIDREGLAVYWATKHYKQFLYCRKFELQTDCSALTKIFGPKNDMNGCAIGRLNRWAAALLEFDFTITHIKGPTNKVCDSLSRLPVPPPGELKAQAPKGTPVDTTQLIKGASVKSANMHCLPEEVTCAVSCLSQLPDPKPTTISICKVIGSPATAVWDVLPRTIEDIAKATREDKIYGKLLSAVRSGNIDKRDPEMKPFISLFDNLHVEQGVIFHGIRCLIPTKLQQDLLEELHQTHPGMVKSKEIARNNFWWPGINQQIESIAKSCPGCTMHRRKPAPAPLCPWPFALRPMERVHIDFCEFKGKQLLIMVDAYSKYIWAHVMNTDTTTMKTLAVLYGWFCERTGFPTTLVSDNGPQFTSHEFANKMSKWGIKHILTPPYHPQSNGIAEKGVGIVKDKLRKMGSSSQPIDLYVNLAACLRVYRASPHSSTCQTPYELISAAPIPVMFPRLQLSHNQKQEKQRSSIPRERRQKARKFHQGDCVHVYDTQSKLTMKGIIKEPRSNNSYIVMINDKERHVSSDHMSPAPKESVVDSVKESDRASQVDLTRNKDLYDDVDFDYSEHMDSNIPLSPPTSIVDPTYNLHYSDRHTHKYFFSDSESVCSDVSETSLLSIEQLQPIHSHVDNVPLTSVNPVPKRKYKAEPEKLIDTLSKGQTATRTRSGIVYDHNLSHITYVNN